MNIPAKSTLVVVPVAQPQTAQPTVQQVVAEFLQAKNPDASPNYRLILYYGTRDLVGLFGNLRMSSILPAMVQQALLANKRQTVTQKVFLKTLKSFFAWCRDHGHLPPGPTAAELVQINEPNDPLRIIHPSELKRILAAEAEVDLRLGIAFWSFAGIGYRELYRLNWENITPTRVILTKPVGKLVFMNSMRIRPVLNAWVAPFYNCRGPVVKSKYLRTACQLHARKVGVGFNPNMLRRSFWVYSSLLRGTHPTAGMPFTGVTGPVSYTHSSALPTLADAQDYFGLTPGAVGLQNWPDARTAVVKPKRARGRPQS